VSSLRFRLLPGPCDCGFELVMRKDVHLPLFCMLSCAGRCLGTGRFRSEHKQEGYKKTWKREVLGGTGVLAPWTKSYIRVDGQTVAEKTVGTVDSTGTSLNSLYANNYGRLNLDACAPVLKVKLWLVH